MNIKLELAPLEGATTSFFRQAQCRHFTAPAKSYTPFISPTQNHRFTSRELGELSPKANEGLNVIPQLIGHNADDFLWAANELKAMGYGEVNLNLGCPSGTVTKKKKGAGLLGDLELLQSFLDHIFEKSPVSISIKTRAGRTDYGETEAIAQLFARYPIAGLIVHPRLERDFYTGPVNYESFEVYKKHCRCDICYNGDLFSRDDIQHFTEAHPDVPAVMCGRGFVANPKLAGEANGEAPLSADEFAAFYEDFFAVTLGRLNCEKQILHHIKEYWLYWGKIFEGADPHLKKLFKAKTTAELSTAAQAIITHCPLKDPAGYHNG